MISASEIGTRYDEAADSPDLVAGQAATMISLLKGILFELKLLRAAVTDTDLETGTPE